MTKIIFNIVSHIPIVLQTGSDVAKTQPIVFFSPLYPSKKYRAIENNIEARYIKRFIHRDRSMNAKKSKLGWTAMGPFLMIQ